MQLADPNPLSSMMLQVLTGAYLVTSMCSLGLEVGAAPKEDKAHRRKQRRLIVRALLINLVLLPLVAVTVIRALHTRGDVALALVLLAAAPGGRFAPQLARIGGGSLALSVEITLFLAKLTAFTAPPLVKALAGVGRFRLHDLSLIAELLLLQVAPYVIGKQMWRWRQLAARLTRPARWLEIATAILVGVFLVARRQFRDVLLIGGSGWLALFLVASLSLALGWLLGGSAPGPRRAIALGVDARNLALALLIAEMAFPERAIEPMVFAVWLVLTTFSVVAALAARRRGAPGPRAHTVAQHVAAA